MYYSREWNTFYKIDYNKNITTNDTIVLTANNRYYIHDLMFIGMKNKPIYYKSSTADDTMLLVENILFSETSYTSNEHGGNICIDTAGNCVQNKICCTNCSFNNWGKHSYIYVKNNENSLNYLKQCSFSHLLGPGYGAFIHNYGDIQIFSSNITKCINTYYSSFYTSYLSKNSSIKISNFQNNTATSVQGLCMDSSNSFTYQLSHCSIINQNCSGTDGVIYVNGYAVLDSCIIKDNFNPNNILFSSRYGTGFYVTNSYISNPEASSNS